MLFFTFRDGLEDQLLAAVVKKERPDLEELKSELTTQQNEFKITLKGLEDNLLARLSSAEGNFLGENIKCSKSAVVVLVVLGDFFYYHGNPLDFFKILFCENILGPDRV